MEKQKITVTLSGEAMEKLDGIMDGITTNRSKMIELAIQIIHTYFSREQLHIEFDMYPFPDGRSNGKQQ